MRNLITNKQKAQKSISTLLTFLLLLCASVAYSQTGTLTGTVTDTTGDPLIGVNVSIKGTTIGSITDINGKYSITGAPANAILVFSYIGFTSQEIPVGNQRTINATLREDTQRLEEVIVVGYGTRKAGEVTGSVSTVRSDEIQKLAAVTTSEVLRTVPGITTWQSNTPGGDATVRVRGLGTINNNDPLWVVDGVPGATVNPDNIETVTVLKDAAAQAIYGTRASNGVILVTTKQGKRNQKANVNFNLRVGTSRNTNSYRMLNTREYGELLWLEAKNSGDNNWSHPQYGSGATPVIPDYIFPIAGKLGEVDESRYSYVTAQEGGTDTYLITKANKEGTDWLKEISRTGLYQDYSMNVTGGGDNTTYSFQFGYMSQEGVFKYNSFDRFNLRSNITSDINKWLQFGESLSVTYSKSQGQMTNYAEDSAVSWAYRMQPIIPVYDIAGNFAGTRGGGNIGNARNPLAVLSDNQYDNTERMNISGNIFGVLKPIEGLSIKTLFGLNYNTRNTKDINYVDKAHAERGTYDYLYRTHDYIRQWNWTNTADYTKTFDNHSVTVMLGTEAIAYDYYQTTAQRYNYALKKPEFIELSTGIDGQQNGSNTYAWSLFSVFGRVNYTYDNKYLFEGVVRRDGSSRFSESNRYGTFPAFSLGWRITNEKFMASTKEWLQMLKLRAGYGLTGNDNLGSGYNGQYNGFDIYNFATGNSFYPLDGANGAQGRVGFRQNTIGSKNVKWETTRTTNVGFDATLLRNLSMTVDVWQRNTKDMLYRQSLPQVYGSITAPNLNVGEMQNRGFDIDLGYTGTALNRDLRYQLNLNISHFKNKIINLSGNKGEFLQSDPFREQNYTRAETGTAFPEFYGYIVEGIFQTQAEVDAAPTYQSYNRVGGYKYKDLNGDGRINAEDRTYLGSAHPKFTGGLNFNVEYKGFDINGQFYGSYGNKLVNYVRRWIDFVQFAGGRSYERLYESWGSPHLSDNSKAKLPIALKSDTQFQLPSTAFIEDASFLRLRNLQLGYNLSKLINSKDVRTMRVYVQVTNLLTFTKYSGLDPEVNNFGGDGRNMGIDAGTYPTPMQILFGLSLGF